MAAGSGAVQRLADALGADTSSAVLVAIDESPDAQAALRWYCENLARPGDAAVLLHVYEPSPLPGNLRLSFIPPALMHEINESVRACSPRSPTARAPACS